MSDATTIDASRIAATDDAGAAPRVYLVVREGARSQVIGLDDGADVLFGRSPEATVQLADAKSSREHARVRRRGGALELVDLGSRNGTRLNGERVRGETRALRSGDLIAIGAAEILVAETAPRRAGSDGRLGAALERLRAGGGRATLVRLALSEEQLAALAAPLGRALLLEEQADGDYAALFDEDALAAALVAAARAASPGATPAVVHAPDDGDDAATLWAKTAPRASRPAPILPGVVVADAAMVAVFERVRKVAAAPTTVLILGETGVGKEVVAEQIHRQSPRAGGPFIRLNCGSLPETLLDSELFGHERGAFTGADKRKLGYVEAAAGGTLFLDEIGELPLPMQTRLLRVLENRKLMRVGGREEIDVDARIVAATNRDLQEEVTAGRFRQDLYFRLSAFIIKVPALRERTAELELLAELFARQFAQRMNLAAPRIAPAALQLLRRHSWPGNVRELRNAMESAVVLAEGGDLAPEHLPDSVHAGAAAPAPASGGMRDEVAHVEKRRIEEALAAEDGNQTRAAKRLGISRRTLQYKLGKYGLH